MKNLRKQQENPFDANHINGNIPSLPIDSMDEQSLLDTSLFSTPPSPRLPESLEEESFRNLLKSNLPQHRASSALLQRIKEVLREENI